MFIICTMAKRRRKRRKLKRQAVYFLIFTGILLISVGLLTRKARRMIPYEPAELVERTRELHDYDWSNLETDGVFASYSDDRYTSLQGIDVSEHQAEIDWKKVKEAGIDFAFIRTGYRGTESGRCTEDRWFRTNMEEASAAGIDIGVYFFSQAVTEEEAAEEADYVADQIKGYDVTYPVVFDTVFSGRDIHRCCTTAPGSWMCFLRWNSLQIIRYGQRNTDPCRTIRMFLRSGSIPVREESTASGEMWIWTSGLLKSDQASFSSMTVSTYSASTVPLDRSRSLRATSSSSLINVQETCSS